MSRNRLAVRHCGFENANGSTSLFAYPDHDPYGRYIWPISAPRRMLEQLRDAVNDSGYITPEHWRYDAAYARQSRDAAAATIADLGDDEHELISYIRLGAAVERDVLEDLISASDDGYRLAA